MGTFNEGAAPNGILTRALTENVFVEKSLAYMNEGDKDGYNVYKHDIKNVLRARTDDPSVGATNTSQKFNFKRDLAVVESFESFDPADYYQHWKKYQPSGEFQWEGLPTEVQSALEELFLGSSVEATEDELTNGDGTLVSGLVPQLRSTAYVTDLSVLGVPATPTQVVNNTSIAFRAYLGGGVAVGTDYEGEALTTTNIFEKLELLISKQTEAMRKRTNRKFMVSNSTIDLISQAQRLELNFKGVDVTEGGIYRYAGYDIVANPSFPANTIILASMGGDFKTDAIQLGTSLSNDFNNLTVARLNGNFNRKWGMALTFALDIFVVRPEEVCFYTDKALI